MKNEKKDFLEAYAEVKGKHIEMGGFSIDVLEDLSIDVKTVSGVFGVRYGVGTVTWGLLLGFIGNDNLTPVETFIKGVVFPTVMRFHDIDSQYVDDILEAHSSLTERNADSGLSKAIEEAFDAPDAEVLAERAILPEDDEDYENFDDE